MADYTYVVERLRAADDRSAEYLEVKVHRADVYEAVDAITALQARNARLEALLAEVNLRLTGARQTNYLNGSWFELQEKVAAALSDETPDTPQDTVQIGQKIKTARGPVRDIKMPPYEFQKPDKYSLSIPQGPFTPVGTQDTEAQEVLRNDPKDREARNHLAGNCAADCWFCAYPQETRDER